MTFKNFVLIFNGEIYNFIEIREKLKTGKKLGFSERARAVNKGILPSKAKNNGTRKKSKKS